MKEQLIQFQTAKLAKEKGFDIPVIYGYGAEKELTEFEENIDYYNLISFNTRLTNNYWNISAPTQSLLQKWLREKYKINVESNFLPNIQKYRYLAKPMNIIPKFYKNKTDYNKTVAKFYSTKNYNTYEEALEKGLYQALKLIKND